MSDSASQNFLNRIRIQKDLERFTGNVLARHANVEQLVARIAALPRADQDFIYHWTEVIGVSDKELAAHFVSRAPRAFERMDRHGVEQWVIQAMDAFDKRGLGFGLEVLDEIERFVTVYANRETGCRFEQVAGFLQHFVIGLGGRELQIAADRSGYTDTQRIFVPEEIVLFADHTLNFRLYKLRAAHLWAQTWYGTWHAAVVERLLLVEDLHTAAEIFNRLECIRLDACLARDFPGLHRQMQALSHILPEHRERWRQWEDEARALTLPGATAEDSCALVAVFAARALPVPKLYQSEMYPRAVDETLRERTAREKADLQRALNKLQQELDRQTPDGDALSIDSTQPGEFAVAEADGEGLGTEINLALQYNGKTVPTPRDIQNLLGSIMQDFGEIPDEYLQPADHGDYPEDLESDAPAHLIGPDNDQYLQDAIAYREWDYTRQRYRENFCLLNELEVLPGDAAFVDETLEKYRGMLRSIKKTFEAIRGETRLQRRQSQGDDIDIDALIEARADAAAGREMSDYVYTQYRNLERSIAVMFMVDMSGSTLGWINQAERESLILLCEALEMLGDRYAIYGFSGRTNKRCEVHRIKTFAEPYGLEVRQRISGIKAKSYTRMGVAIRHLGHLLNQTRARTKLLIALSDGRPEDYGGYKGRYGIEDTRHALLELRRDGIHPFCITIDKEALDYLPHMYGAANYAVIDEVQKLPYKVADIYRRLTT